MIGKLSALFEQNRIVKYLPALVIARLRSGLTLSGDAVCSIELGGTRESKRK